MADFLAAIAVPSGSKIGNEGWDFSIGDPDTTTVDLINGLNHSDLNQGKTAFFG